MEECSGSLEDGGNGYVTHRLAPGRSGQRHGMDWGEMLRKGPGEPPGRAETLLEVESRIADRRARKESRGKRAR